MNRLQLRRPATMRRRSIRARRIAVARDLPMKYSEPKPAPRWLVLGTGLLGAGVAVELLVGMVVAS